MIILCHFIFDFESTYHLLNCSAVQSDDDQKESTPRKEYVTPHGGIPASEIGLNYAPRTPNPLRVNGSSDPKPSGPPLQYGLTPEICVIQADAEPSVTPQRVTTDI